MKTTEQTSLFDEKYTKFTDLYCGKTPCIIIQKDKTHALIQLESGSIIATPINSLDKNYGKILTKY